MDAHDLEAGEEEGECEVGVGGAGECFCEHAAQIRIDAETVHCLTEGKKESEREVREEE